MRLLIFILLVAASAAAQDRPPLFFREDWKETPAATPVTQDHVANPNLLLALYGPGKDGIKKSHHDSPADDPYYIWTGTCPANCAIALHHRTLNADLRGQSKIVWRSKQAGFRYLRIILKLANGAWLVSDQFDDASQDWRIREFNVSDIHWRALDIKLVVEGAWAEKPDLSSVEEIGWTDLMPGGASLACSRVDWIEVYANSSKR